MHLAPEFHEARLQDPKPKSRSNALSGRRRSHSLPDWRARGLRRCRADVQPQPWRGRQRCGCRQLDGSSAPVRVPVSPGRRRRPASPGRLPGRHRWRRTVGRKARVAAGGTDGGCQCCQPCGAVAVDAAVRAEPGVSTGDQWHTPQSCRTRCRKKRRFDSHLVDDEKFLPRYACAHLPQANLPPVIKFSQQATVMNRLFTVQRLSTASAVLSSAVAVLLRGKGPKKDQRSWFRYAASWSGGWRVRRRWCSPRPHRRHRRPPPPTPPPPRPWRPRPRRDPCKVAGEPSHDGFPR